MDLAPWAASARKARGCEASSLGSSASAGTKAETPSGGATVAAETFARATSAATPAEAETAGKANQGSGVIADIKNTSRDEQFNHRKK